jgi:hypothetical protein
MLRKCNDTLAGNYVVANGSQNMIPNKGPCFAWHTEDGSTMIMVFQKNYNNNEMKYISCSDETLHWAVQPDRSGTPKQDPKSNHVI